MLNLSGVINVKFYYYKQNVLYESKVSLVKPLDIFNNKHRGLSLKDSDIIRSDMKYIRKQPNMLIDEKDVLKELNNIANSDIMDFSKIYNLMISKSDINTLKLRDLLKEYLEYFKYSGEVVYSNKEESGILRLERSSFLNSYEYAHNIASASHNTLFLDDLGIKGKVHQLT